MGVHGDRDRSDDLLVRVRAPEGEADVLLEGGERGFGRGAQEGAEHQHLHDRGLPEQLSGRPLSPDREQECARQSQEERRECSAGGLAVQIVTMPIRDGNMSTIHSFINDSHLG